MAILGCGESDAPCREVRDRPSRATPARPPALAATERALMRHDDLPYPTVVAQCRPAGAGAAAAARQRRAAARAAPGAAPPPRRRRPGLRRHSLYGGRPCATSDRRTRVELGQHRRGLRPAPHPAALPRGRCPTSRRSIASGSPIPTRSSARAGDEPGAAELVSPPLELAGAERQAGLQLSAREGREFGNRQRRPLPDRRRRLLRISPRPPRRPKRSARTHWLFTSAARTGSASPACGAPTPRSARPARC